MQATPAQVLTLFFFIIISLGAFFLNLPGASVTGKPIGLLNSFFTSTSAVCVTGLVVVDVGTQFTLFGKIVVMCLIQAGALGIMTMATVIYVFLRRKLSVHNMVIMKEALNQGSMGFLREAIKNVVKLTFGCELLGAALLSIRFIPLYGMKRGIFHSVFHAVSAFCNAGFDLNGHFSSLTKFADDPLVVLTISGLIIMGGLGFAVIREILVKKPNRRFSLQTRIVISMTVILLAVGTILYYLIERNNPATLGDPNMGFGTKVMSAFFQSVTTRTAGFNTISQEGLRDASKVVSMALMFIGASPASTGGGIKTTTFCLLVLTAWTVVRGKDDINVRNRRIAWRQVLQAVTVAMIALTIVFFAGAVIKSLEPAQSFENVFFEVFSAFGTVGLSTGMTPSLSSASRVVLILTMFVGRVGPITFVMALAGTRDEKRKHRLMAEDILIG